jgi:hypothetical protein
MIGASTMSNTSELGPLERRLIDADLGHLADELPDPVVVVAGSLRDASTGLLTA